MSDPAPDIRLAATVIVARPSVRGPEILVQIRSSRHRFLPGYTVFPGGALDPEDGDLAARLFGDAAEAGRAAALRELNEEVGLAVTASGVRAEPFESTLADPPRAGALCEVSHWVAPEDVPVRFDTRFYAVACDADVVPVPDGVEVERVWWGRPFDLAEASASGGLSLYWPTMKVIEGLVACRRVDEILAARIPQVETEHHVVG